MPKDICLTFYSAKYIDKYSNDKTFWPVHTTSEEDEAGYVIDISLGDESNFTCENNFALYKAFRKFIVGCSEVELHMCSLNRTSKTIIQLYRMMYWNAFLQDKMKEDCYPPNTNDLLSCEELELFLLDLEKTQYERHKSDLTLIAASIVTYDID